MTVYTPGTQRRTFGHVQDVVNGLTKLMECDEAVGELVNVGGTAECSMLDLAEVVKFRAQSQSPIQTVPAPYVVGYDDIESRRPDLTKIYDLVGYRPHWTLDSIVDDVLATLPERKLVLV